MEENTYKNLPLMDKARFLLEAACYNKTREVDAICGGRPEDVPRLFRFAAALAIVHQPDIALQLVAETAAQKMARGDLQAFAAATLEGAINANSPGHVTVLFGFMKEHNLPLPALENSLAACLGRNDRKEMAATLVAAGADVRAAMDIHEAEVLRDIRRHRNDILQLRNSLAEKKKAYGLEPAARRRKGFG